MSSERKKSRPRLIGVISDTHGLVRPEALAALRGMELIVHAGDIGSPEVVAALESVAAVAAIRGNNDHGVWARRFPETAIVRIDAVGIYLIHNLDELDLDPAAAGYRVVVSGHSHKPSAVERGGVLFLNPGSAGPRRFKLPVAVARLRLEGPSVEAEIVPLEIPPAQRNS
ncbi:MAG TPA: metallophosphoesterase family protein [Candidatus Binatia bacterium]